MSRASLALIWLAAASLPARAQSVDLNAESCRDFLSAAPAQVDATVAWLDGYYQDEDAAPVIDFDTLKTNTAKLKAFCTAHRDRTVGAAAEKLFNPE